jgi:hypothetical protein
LTSTVETGQIWLATHSLEAVEAAGQQATFVLERNEKTRKVDSLSRLDQRPVLSALSRAVGTPAFSISNLLFVFIEGEEGVGERERFRKLAGLPQDVRFMECGSCNEVLRRVGVIKALANESEAGMRICGVVDRDFRSDADAMALGETSSVLVLPVHEVENFFLHPGTLELLIKQNGCEQLRSLEVVQQAADARAGSWVFQYAMATRNSQHLPEVAKASKDLAKQLQWQQLSAERDASLDRIVKASSFDAANQAKLREILGVGIDAYARKRSDDTLWKTCEGKQVLNDVARALGFAGAPALTQAAFAAWSQEGTAIPDELAQLRTFLGAL